MTTKILIVDDEPPARLRMQQLLAEIGTQFPTQVVGMVDSGPAALEAVLTRFILDVFAGLPGRGAVSGPCPGAHGDHLGTAPVVAAGVAAHAASAPALGGRMGAGRSLHLSPSKEPAWMSTRSSSRSPGRN